MKRTFISKTDLAVAYFPYVNQHTARHKLMELIGADSQLMQKLQESGYTKLCRLLSPKQVDMVVEKFGNPWR